MDLLVQLSRDLQKAKSAGLVHVTTSKSIYSDPTNCPNVITTIEFVNAPTHEQMSKLYAYIKGSYNNILLDLRASADPVRPRLELVTKDNPLELPFSDQRT